MGTGWTFVWSYNAAWAIIMACNFVLMTIGAFWFWPRYIGTICNCCLGCCHISGIGFMLAGALNPYPRICSFNKSTAEYKGDYEWDYDGMTYQNEHSLMLGFAIVQLIFWTVQCCCCCLPLCTTPVKDEAHKAEKDGKKQLKKMEKEMTKQNMQMQMQMQQN